MKFQMRYFTLGGIGALITKPVLSILSNGLSIIPGLDVSLQSVSVSTTGLGSVIDPALNVYFQQLFGMINAPFTLPQWLMLFVGGGLFVLLGAYLTEFFKLPKVLGIKQTKFSRLATIFVIASLVTSAIIAFTLSIPPLASIVALSINAIILSWILVTLDETLGTKLVPP